MRSQLGLVLGMLLATTPAAAQRVAHGRVLDSETRLPVAGALVRVAGREAGVLSAADGSWRLPVPTDAQRLRVDHIAYARVERDTRATTGELVIALDPIAVSLETLVVTASRRIQRLKDTPVTTELVTEREIAESGVMDAAALLTERTGIELQGGHPTGAGAMLQGFGAERVLVLLDGQPLPGRMSGNFDLARIPVSLLERVEVVKGPQSTLFGSDALGGVINLITRTTGSAFGGSAELVGGTQGRLNMAGRMYGGIGPISLLGDVGHRTIQLTPGVAETSSATTDQWDGLVKARWRAAPQIDVEASTFIVREAQRWQSGLLYSFADNSQSAYRIGAQWRSGAHQISPTAHVSEFRHEPRRSTSSQASGAGTVESQKLVEAELLHSLDLGAHTLDSGVELKRESINSPNVSGARRALDGIDGFTQLTLTRGALSIVPGVRFSTSELWGAHWTPRVALLYRPIPALAVRASAGSAFRAPAFKELYMSFVNVGPGYGYVVRGNPELQPETSHNLSLGGELSAGRYYARVQLFYNRFADFIETYVAGDSSGLSLYSYGNIEAGVTRGFEVETNTTWRGARLELGYSYLDARNRATDERLLGRPTHAAHGSAAYTLPFGGRVSVTAVYTGSTPLERAASALREREAYTRMDARIARTVIDAFELSVGVENVFDRTPADWPGFTGRQAHIGMSWRPSTIRNDYEETR